MQLLEMDTSTRVQILDEAVCIYTYYQNHWERFGSNYSL